MKLFVVGQFVGEYEKGNAWSMQGVFDTEEEALENCTCDNYFIGPIELNQSLPHDTSEWPGCYYPNLQDVALENQV